MCRRIRISHDVLNSSCLQHSCRVRFLANDRIVTNVTNRDGYRFECSELGGTIQSFFFVSLPRAFFVSRISFFFSFHDFSEISEHKRESERNTAQKKEKKKKARVFAPVFLSRRFTCLSLLLLLFLTHTHRC